MALELLHGNDFDYECQGFCELNFFALIGFSLIHSFLMRNLTLSCLYAIMLMRLISTPCKTFLWVHPIKSHNATFLKYFLFYFLCEIYYDRSVLFSSLNSHPLDLFCVCSHGILINQTCPLI